MEDTTSRKPRRTTERARLAGLVSTLGHDHPRTKIADRDLRARALEDHIAEVLAKAPPLSQAQRAKLAGLLRPAVAGPAPAEAEGASA